MYYAKIDGRKRRVYEKNGKYFIYERVQKFIKDVEITEEESSPSIKRTPTEQRIKELYKELTENTLKCAQQYKEALAQHGVDADTIKKQGKLIIHQRALYDEINELKNQLSAEKDELKSACETEVDHLRDAIADKERELEQTRVAFRKQLTAIPDNIIREYDEKLRTQNEKCNKQIEELQESKHKEDNLVLRKRIEELTAASEEHMETIKGQLVRLKECSTRPEAKDHLRKIDEITRDFEKRIADCNGTVGFLEKQLKPKGTYTEANRLRDQAEVKLKAENTKLREDLGMCTVNMEFLEKSFTEAGEYTDRLRSEKIAIEEKYKLLEKLHRDKLENTAATLGGYNKSSQSMKDSIQDLQDRTHKLTETIHRQADLLKVNSFSTKISAISDRHQQEISDLTDTFVRKNEECEERFNRKNDLLHESDNLLAACNTNYRVCKEDLNHLKMENEKLEALYNSIGQRYKILASDFEDVTRRLEEYKTEMQQSITSDSQSSTGKSKDRGMSDKLKALDDEVSALTEEKTALEEQLRTRDKEIKQITAKYSKLIKENEAIRAENDSVAEILERCSNYERELSHCKEHLHES